MSTYYAVSSGSVGATAVVATEPLTTMYDDVESHLAGVVAPEYGDTPSSHALETAFATMQGRGGSNSPVIILLSDGVPNVNNRDVYPSTGNYRYLANCVYFHPLEEVWTAPDVQTNINAVRVQETSQQQYDIGCQPRQTPPPRDGYGVPLADMLQSAWNHHGDGVPVHTVAIGSYDGGVYNPFSMQLVADMTGGVAYTPDSFSELQGAMLALAAPMCGPTPTSTPTRTPTGTPSSTPAPSATGTPTPIEGSSLGPTSFKARETVTRMAGGYGARFVGRHSK